MAVNATILITGANRGGLKFISKFDRLLTVFAQELAEP
jgi:hypothetical protein